MKLSRNTIVITGATSGIGRGLARRFYAAGNTVIATGRRADRLAELARELPGLVTRVVDVSVEAERVALAAWVAAEHPKTNVLVNNAGVQHAGAPGAGWKLAQAREEWTVNVEAPLHLTDLFVPVLAGRPGAAVVNVSSGLAFAPLAFMTGYCATKAAVHSFTMSSRFALAPRGIEVIEIIPPSVDTELGASRRPPEEASHGGMPLDEFLDGVWSGLEAGSPEIAVGASAGMRQKGEALFETMNRR